MPNKSHRPHWGTYMVLVALLLGTVGLVVAQVVTANTATKVESALFSVLQFIFSLAFAWILTKVVTEQQFVESQRKFAIGAFRRIREIERSLNRTQKYVTNAEGRTERSQGSEFAVIRAGLMNAQDAVRSSIADWADIIGDEIEVTNEIRRLRQLKAEADEGNLEGDLGRRDEKGPAAASTDTDIDNQIVRLTSELPAEMRVALEEEEVDGISLAFEYLGNQWKKNQALELSAFWEPGDSFKGNMDSVQLGATLFIARGMTEHRNGVLLVYNAQGNWIAVVLNECTEVGCDYDDFLYALERFYGRPLLPKSFGGTPLAAKVVAINDADEKREGRHFRLRVSKIPDHPCAQESIEE